MAAPREHGAWFMYLAPLFLGMVLGGERWGHFFLFLASSLAFLGFQSFLQWVRKKEKSDLRRCLLLLALAGSTGGWLPLVYPPLAYLLLVLLLVVPVNLHFLRQKQERHWTNDLAAIAGLSLTGPAAYILGQGRLDATAWLIWAGSVLYFMASVLYVKTIIRERDNLPFRRISYAYHLLLPLVWGLALGWNWALPFLPSLLRALLTPYPSTLTPPKVAVIESLNLLVSFLLVAALASEVFHLPCGHGFSHPRDHPVGQGCSCSQFQAEGKELSAGNHALTSLRFQKRYP